MKGTTRITQSLLLRIELSRSSSREYEVLLLVEKETYKTKLYSNLNQTNKEINLTSTSSSPNISNDTSTASFEKFFPVMLKL